MNKKIFKNMGFTIIETLVAVSVLVIAVTGPLSLASKGLAYSQYAKDEITAFYLANEALDVVRNIRDSNIRSGDDWLKLPGTSASDNLVGKCSSGCFFDVWKKPVDIKSTFGAWSSSDIRIKACSDGKKTYFGHSFNSLGTTCSQEKIQETIFSRKVVIKSVNLNEINVSVLVSWTATNGLPRNVLISENLLKLASL